MHRGTEWSGTIEIDGLPLWVAVDFDESTVEEVVLDVMPPIDIKRFAAEYGTYTQAASSKVQIFTTLEDKVYELAYNKYHDGLPIGE